MGESMENHDERLDGIGFSHHFQIHLEEGSSTQPPAQRPGALEKQPWRFCRYFRSSSSLNLEFQMFLCRNFPQVEGKT